MGVHKGKSGGVWSAELRDWMTRNGLKQQSLARLVGVTQASVSKWLSGRKRPSAEVYAKLALLAKERQDQETFRLRAFAVAGVQELADMGADSLFKSTASDARDGDVIQIPLLKDAAAAGTGRVIDQKEIADTFVFARRFFTGTGKFLAFKVAGDSMSPIIEDGYIVIIDITDTNPRRLIKQMVAARDGEGVTIKWLRKDGPYFMLVPQHTSKRHQVRVLDQTGDFGIVGRVVKWIGEPPR